MDEFKPLPQTRILRAQGVNLPRHRHRVSTAENQGLTLVHFSAQPKPFWSHLPMSPCLIDWGKIMHPTYPTKCAYVELRSGRVLAPAENGRDYYTRADINERRVREERHDEVWRSEGGLQARAAVLVGQVMRDHPVRRTRRVVVAQVECKSKV